MRLLILLLLTPGAVWGLEVQEPYIESLRQQMAEEGKPVEPASGLVGQTPYINKLRAKAEEEETKKDPEERIPTGSYIELLKAQDPKAFAETDKVESSQSSWLEQEKTRLGTEKAESPIRDMQEGRTRKNLTRQDEPVKNAFGIRVNAFATRGFVAEGSAQDFSSIYQSAWYPEIIAFYERQLLSSETWGALGLGVTSGFGFFQGTGFFAKNLRKPWSADPDNPDLFGTTSRTQLTFISVPLFAGVSYRMNFLKYLRPYAQAMAGGIGAIEMRNDGLSNKYAYGIAVAASGGVNFLLNWIDPKGSFELFDTFGVNRFYLTADLTAQIPLFGLIRYTNVAFSAGMTYEF